MANATDFIHPIIQSIAQYVASKNERAQRDLQLAGLIEKKRSSQEDEKHAQDQLKQQKDIADAAHNLAQSQLDTHKQQLAHEQKQAGFENLLKLIGKSGLPTESAPFPGMPNKTITGGNTGMISDPLTGQEYSRGLFEGMTPEAEGARKIQEAGGVAGATAAAQYPYVVAADERRADREAANQTAIESRLLAGKAEDYRRTQELEDKKIASNERIAAITNASRERTSLNNAKIRLQAAALGIETDDETLNKYRDGLFINGNIKLSEVPQKLRNLVLQGNPGFTVLNSKDQEVLNGIPLVQELIGATKDLAKQGTGITGRAAAATGIGFLGEAGVTRQKVDALLGNVARIFGGEKGVLTQKDIERAKGMIYAVSNKEADNTKKAAELESFLNSKIQPILGKYNKEQLTQILATKGIDPERYIKKTMIELDDGTRIPDTPQNRKLHGLE